MQFVSRRLSWRMARTARPLTVGLTFLAMMLGLLGAAGQYQNASAKSIFDPQPAASPHQVPACIAPGTQQPVDPTGGAVTIRMIDDGDLFLERTPVHQLTLTDGSAIFNSF